METVRRRFRMDRSGIALVRFILEGYDGIAVLSTLDAKRGEVEVSIAPGCEAEVEEVLNDIGTTVLMEETLVKDGK